MKIKIIGVGQKMPSWVIHGVEEYTKRMPSQYPIEFIEIPLKKRTKNVNLERLMDKEGQAMVSFIPEQSRVVALDVKGQALSSFQLSERIIKIEQSVSNLCILIGGPEGLPNNARSHCHESWSLSRLTLPHPLVRVIIAEALYRAWTIINKHPYHK